ncbi:MAG: isochorismatase [Alphaproteobacteria bacterium]
MQYHVREPFRPRSVRYAGIREEHGWRIKQYRVTYENRPYRPEDFAPAIETALGVLPQPPVTPARPGVAVLIAHQGREADYLVLAWWDNENELPVRVWVRDGSGWRTAGTSESFCVWDLEILWHEREAFVRHMLSPPAGPDAQAYLEDNFT